MISMTSTSVTSPMSGTETVTDPDAAVAGAGLDEPAAGAAADAGLDAQESLEAVELLGAAASLDAAGAASCLVLMTQIKEPSFNLSPTLALIGLTKSAPQEREY